MEKHCSKKLCIIIFSILSILSVFGVTSCGYNTLNYFYPANDVDSRVKKFTDLGTIDITETKYDVLILTDHHFDINKKEIDQDKFFKFLDNNSNYKFCLSLGDIIDRGQESEYNNYVKFANRITKDYNIPIYTSIGNHDLFFKGWEYWKKNIYPHTTLYSFKTKNISWYCLDTGTGRLGKKQFDLLAEEMAKDTNAKIVFTHYPLFIDKFIFEMQDSTETNLLFSLFATNNVKYILSGHIHAKKETTNSYFTEKTIPSLLFDDTVGILHIDEDTGSYSLEIVSYK